MATELAFDLFYGVGNEKEIFELSYATFAEELQLQEILKESMIASENATNEASSSSSSSSLPLPLPSPASTPEAISSPGSGSSLEEIERAFNFKTEKELEDAVCEAIKKSGCPDYHRLSCTECTNPQDSGLNCHEQQSINWDEKRREHFRARKPRGGRSSRHSKSNFNVRKMEDIPRTSSSESHAKKSWRGSGTGNIQDPKGKGIALDDDDYDDMEEEEEFDSDASQKKKYKWFKELFERMDALNNIDEINETVWHCPACQGGPDAIKWYRSIQDLIEHAKKIGTRRVKLHRELVQLLEVELLSKGASIAPPAAQILGHWKGLNEDATDPQIVWPPMVVIMNTMTSFYKDGKCVGMGSQELLEHFSSYPVLKALHSYGPKGHRGVSVLIFESSAVGYLEAERLHKSFVGQGWDRLAWNSCQHMGLTGGERQLYGFMAVKEDLDIFNHHCQGKSKIKYELKSYREAVLNGIKKMSEDSQKERFEEERSAKAFQGSVDNLSRNLQQKMKDIQTFKRRVQLLHEQNQEEMESQEKFYEDRIKILEARVKELEKLQETDANSVHTTGEPASALACLIEEHTPRQYTSNLSIDDEDSRVEISSHAN